MPHVSARESKRAYNNDGRKRYGACVERYHWDAGYVLVAVRVIVRKEVPNRSPAHDGRGGMRYTPCAPAIAEMHSADQGGAISKHMKASGTASATVSG